MKSLVIFTFFFTTSSFILIGQGSSKNKFHAGLKAGMNTSQMTGDGFSGFYKFSLVAGAFATTKINDKWKFQYELVYQGKGSNKPARPDEGDYESYKINLNYIEVPLLIQYQLKKFEVEFGPGLGVLIGSKEWDKNGALAKSNNWRTFELDAVLGLNYYVNDNFFINARSHHSVTSIVTTSVANPYRTYGGAWNIVIALTFNYQF
jgi:hypothetical protein